MLADEMSRIHPSDEISGRSALRADRTERSLKAIGFDLGDTLIEYENLPLSWESLYPQALDELARFLGISLVPSKLEAACSCLRFYNTRLRPRVEEVSFSEILIDLLGCFKCSTNAPELNCAAAFFSVFRQKLICFPDTILALERARSRGLRIGVFTDVPYGMPREFVAEDVEAVGLTPLINVLLTSRETGMKKTLASRVRGISAQLKCSAEEMVYVGNERKDIEAALAFGCEGILVDVAGPATCLGPGYYDCFWPLPVIRGKTEGCDSVNVFRSSNGVGFCCSSHLAKQLTHSAVD